MTIPSFSINALNPSFLGEVLDLIPNPVFVKDVDHRWVMTNSAFCEFIGHSKEELIGRTDRDFFPKEEVDIFWEQDDLVIQTKKESINEESVTDKFGNIRFFSTHKSLIIDSNGKELLVAILHDITEKKNLIQGLKESNSILSNYANMVAHDLKSPLKTMVSFSQLLSRSAKEKLNEAEKEYLGFISKSAKGMS